MAKDAPFTKDDGLFTGAKATLRFTVEDSAGAAVDITGWTFEFELHGKGFDAAASAPITKTSGDGISISDAAAGQVDVTLDAADTTGWAGSTSPQYEYRLRRTNSGNEAMLAYGTFVLQQG